MGTPPDLSLSPSEKRTLQKVSEGEFQVVELDWVALQRLESTGPHGGAGHWGRDQRRGSTRFAGPHHEVLSLSPGSAPPARLHPPMQACPLPEGAGRRLRAVSLVNGQAFEMPITQAELGDATGLSTVHVNRTLQELRGDGLITTPKNGRVVIEDWDGLQKAGEFDPTYLHIKKQAA
jgi:Crp-like helix-turn-helix domain